MNGCTPYKGTWPKVCKWEPKFNTHSATTHEPWCKVASPEEGYIFVNSLPKRWREEVIFKNLHKGWLEMPGAVYLNPNFLLNLCYSLKIHLELLAKMEA